MEELYLKFNNDPEYAYAIKINSEGVTVYGCDCSDKMSNEVIEKVYEKLGELLNERKGTND